MLNNVTKQTMDKLNTMDRSEFDVLWRDAMGRHRDIVSAVVAAGIDIGESENAIENRVAGIVFGLLMAEHAFAEAARMN